MVMDKKLDQKAKDLNLCSDSYLLITCFGASLTCLGMKRLDAIPFFFLLRFYVFIFRESGREKEREKNINVRKTSIGCLSLAPGQGTQSTTSHMPWLGIQPLTFCFV